MKKLLLVILLFFISTPILATDYPVDCSGDIASAIQSAVNSASNDDTISIGAGSCTMSSSVTITNKNITIQGAGSSNTTITTNYAFNFINTSLGAFRVTGIAFVDTTSNNAQMIRIFSASTSMVGGWRIDNSTFTGNSCSQNIAVNIIGIQKGVIDHCTFVDMGNAIFNTWYVENSIEVNPWPPDGDPGMGGYAWNIALNEGSDEAIYVEDSTFTLSSGCYYGVGDMYYGARFVFRYNDVTNAYFQSHYTRYYERGGSAWVEIYNNNFNATDSGWYRAIHIRAGTGVIYNNYFTGYFDDTLTNTIELDDNRANGVMNTSPYNDCDGGESWDGNVEGDGWPCLDQIGTSPDYAFGATPTLNPFYVWNNGNDAGCSTGGACSNNITAHEGTVTSTQVRFNDIDSGNSHTGGVYDVYNNGTTPKSGYTPYTYPHPLVADTTSPTFVSFTILSSGIQGEAIYSDSSGPLTDSTQTGYALGSCSGGAVGVTYNSISGLTVTVDFDRTILDSETGCVYSYTAGGLQDSAASPNAVSSHGPEATYNTSGEPGGTGAGVAMSNTGTNACSNTGTGVCSN